MADGSIRIETNLDNSRLKQQIKELERELKNVRKEQAKVDAQADGAMAKYREEMAFDYQFPEEFSHRKDIDDRAAKELDPIIAKQEELNQKEQQYIDKLTAANAKLSEQSSIAAASKQVDNDAKNYFAVGKIQTQEQYNSLLEATRAKMEAIEAAAARVAAQTGLSKDQILAANPAYQKLSDTMSMLNSRVGELGSNAKAAGKKAGDGFKHANKEAKKFGDTVNRTVKKGIKMVGKMALAVFGIRGAYRAVRMAMTEYMQTNEALEGKIDTLKAAFGQALGPAIEWVVNLVWNAVNAVNSFVYALTGINLAAKANEAALKKQEKATESAAKAANQLAGFDEQTKLTDTSGSGNGSSGNSVQLLDDTIKPLAGLAEKLKEQILGGDWYGAGQTLGEALMNGIKSVDWHGLGAKVGEILGGALSFVLGFALSWDPLVMLGSIVELVSGLMDGLSEAIQNIDWVEVGKDFVDLLIKAIIAQLIWMNPYARIIALICTPQGTELANSTSEMAGSIIGALFAAIVGMAQRIFEIPKAIFNFIKTHFIESIDWGGAPGDVINGLFNGIIEALKSVGTWIYNNIWVPFRDGFKKAFGINSPSTKMKEFGGYMMDGLYNGITGAISRVVSACQQIWSSIKNVFSSVGDWFKNKFTEAWTNVKNVFSTGGKIFSGIKEGVEITFKAVVNSLIDGINKIISKPFIAINNMLNTIRSTKVMGVQPFLNLWDRNPLIVPEIPKLALGGIVNRPGRGVPAIVGEAGAEAVLPLENNTEWMDILADKIGGGNITIPIYMDGKKMYTYIIDVAKRKAFAANGG